MRKIELSELARNWHLAQGYGDVRLADVSTRRDRQILRQGDVDGDGALSLAEAWTYIGTHSALPTPSLLQRLAAQLLFTRGPTASAEEFADALSRLLTERAQRPIIAGERTLTLGEVLYLQFNAPHTADTREARDVRRFVAEDRDHPGLHQLNMTARFNAMDLDRFTVEFTRQMSDYLGGLDAEKKALTGLIISGHSNGLHMLQEVSEHGQHGYLAKLDVRERLWDLRNNSARHRALFDRVEYVVLQACFHGAAIAEWSRIFPNATIVGTRNFAPSQDRIESGQMVQAAIVAATAVERGSNSDDAVRAGLQGVAADLTAARELVIDTPDRRAERARANLDLAAARFAAVRERVSQFVAAVNAVIDEKGNDVQTAELLRGMATRGWRPQEYRDLYVAVNTYYLARRSVWALTSFVDGQPPPALPDDIANLAEIRDVLFSMRMLANV